MSKKIKKPKLVKRTHWDYHELIQYINKKYKRDPDDWAGRFKVAGNTDQIPFLCFWHWILDTYSDIHNGSEFTLNLDKSYNEGAPDWVLEILELIKTEFAPNEDSITVWVEW